MTNTIYKAIMMRTKFRLKTVETRVAYNKQRNRCLSLTRNAKKHFYENFDPNLVTDNRKFWKQVKPVFPTKTPDSSKTLLGGNQLINENLACAEVPKNYFIDAVDELDIDRGSAR